MRDHALHQPIFENESDEEEVYIEEIEESDNTSQEEVI